MGQQTNHIDYIEFKTKDIEAVKTFYTNTFDWVFTDYGPTYTSFEAVKSGVAGGFELTQDEIVNGALVVLYHENLDLIQDKVKTYGGIITKSVFSFPGGHRFHFKDPSGNELAVWSDQ